MQIRSTLARPRLPGIVRAARALAAALRRRRPAPPDADSLSPHLRRDVGLPPEAERPPKEPPLRIF